MFSDNILHDLRVCQSGTAMFVTELNRKKTSRLETRSQICACVQVKPKNILIVTGRCSIDCARYRWTDH